MQFLKATMLFVVLPAVLGLACGDLYQLGILTDEGLWVDALGLAEHIFLDKLSYVVELAIAGYLIIWGLLGQLKTVSEFGRWVVVKCSLGLVVVPAFVLAARYFIPALDVATRQTILLALVGYVQAAVVYWLLLHPKTEPSSTNQQ